MKIVPFFAFQKKQGISWVDELLLPSKGGLSKEPINELRIYETLWETCYGTMVNTLRAVGVVTLILDSKISSKSSQHQDWLMVPTGFQCSCGMNTPTQLLS
jgi:hypothetical protein